MAENYTMDQNVKTPIKVPKFYFFHHVQKQCSESLAALDLSFIHQLTDQAHCIISGGQIHTCVNDNVTRMCPEVCHQIGFSSELFLAHFTLVHYSLVPAGSEKTL